MGHFPVILTITGGLVMSVRSVWGRVMTGWVGVMLLTACQYGLVISMINVVTTTIVLSVDECADGPFKGCKEISFNPEDASWWFYLVGVLVIVLGAYAFVWRPFENVRQNVVTRFFLGAMPALFAVVLMIYQSARKTPYFECGDVERGPRKRPFSLGGIVAQCIAEQPI